VTQEAKLCSLFVATSLNCSYTIVSFNQSFRMNFKLKCIGLFFLIMACRIAGFSQVSMPSDLSRVKSSQITDAQLMQFIQQAEASGADESELMQEFQKRGLPESELQALSARVKSLMGSTQPKGSVTSDEKSMGNKRTYKGEMTEFKRPEKPSRVFGSELFSGVDPLFVPNLKIATPKGYVIGPEDELQLDIYGNNIATQKMMVSPDGFVTLKYAGPVNVSGMTIEQAASVFKARLTKFYPALANGGTKLQLTLGSLRSIQVIVVGAVKKPGTITLPSVAKLFNALYASGGPLENGSFRNIELVRNSKVVAVADLYDFILKGEQTSNLTLQDNDVIRVPFAKQQVVLEGGVNRKGIFEIGEKESIQQLLDFAGGFKSNAFRGRITGTRYTDVEKKVIDIAKTDFQTFHLLHGDSLYVDSVIDRYENRVYISGAVFKPGAYALDKDLDVKGLIQKAQGLKEDAFVGRVNMVRLKEDRTKEYKSFGLKEILSGNEKIALRREDSLHVLSILELRDSTTVSVLGLVRKPGDYRYEDSLSLQSILLQAGGFQENATPSRIEIGRRKMGVNPSEKGSNTSEIIQLDLNKDLSKIGSDVFLKPFDVISVKADPSKVKQVSVKISGEVLYAGTYTLSNPEERLSSVVNRAGGLLPYADINGAKLIRKKEKVDTAQIKRLALSTIKISTFDDKDKDKDTSKLVKDDELKSQTTEVALDLSRILENPGSVEDLTLQDSDELIVPRFVNTVAVSGEVLKPVTIQYEEGKGLSNYLSAAGGFTRNAYKNRVFIVYSNGRSSKTHAFLMFRSYPKVLPGCSIFVPLRQDTKSFDPAKAGILVSALSAVMTGLVLLFR
jgi:protein involved in polysaccharide export with SLBB domain